MSAQHVTIEEFVLRMANDEASYGTGYYGQDSWLASYQGAKRLAMEALCCSRCLGSGEQQYEIYAGDQVVEDGVRGCAYCAGSGDRSKELAIASQWGAQ